MKKGHLLWNDWMYLARGPEKMALVTIYEVPSSVVSSSAQPVRVRVDVCARRVCALGGAGYTTWAFESCICRLLKRSLVQPALVPSHRILDAP